jgi:hypothetical protein
VSGVTIAKIGYNLMVYVDGGWLTAKQYLNLTKCSPPQQIRKDIIVPIALEKLEEKK